MDIIGNNKIQLGLWWNIEGHKFTVISINDNKCRIKEEWVAEDTGASCISLDTYNINTDINGHEFASNSEYENWKFYASSAFNYPIETLLNSDKNDIEEDNEYIPSSTRGDYGPSNPWNAPGMSIHDFI